MFLLDYICLIEALKLFSHFKFVWWISTWHEYLRKLLYKYFTSSTTRNDELFSSCLRWKYDENYDDDDCCRTKLSLKKKISMSLELITLINVIIDYWIIHLQYWKVEINCWTDIATKVNAGESREKWEIILRHQCNKS